MLREDRFVQSHRPYAVDMSSLHTEAHLRDDGSAYYSGRIDAVWFRRRSAGYGAHRRIVTTACAGHLWDYQDTGPADPEQFLKQHDDGRFGGRCESRWDGERFWSASQSPEATAAHLELLRPMLAAYPACPDGYSGWWRF